MCIVHYLESYNNIQLYYIDNFYVKIDRVMQSIHQLIYILLFAQEQTMIIRLYTLLLLRHLIP